MSHLHKNYSDIVFVIPRPSGSLVCFVRCGGHGQILFNIVRNVKTQFDIFLHVLEGLLDFRKTPVVDELSLVGQITRGPFRQIEDLQKVLTRETASLGQDHALGQSGKPDTQSHVDAQIHLGRRPYIAQIKCGFTDSLETRLTIIEERLIAGRQDDQTAALRLFLAPLHLGLQVAPAFTFDDVTNIFGSVRIDGGHLHVAFAGQSRTSVRLVYHSAVTDHHLGEKQSQHRKKCKIDDKLALLPLSLNEDPPDS